MTSISGVDGIVLILHLSKTRFKVEDLVFPLNLGPQKRIFKYPIIIDYKSHSTFTIFRIPYTSDTNAKSNFERLEVFKSV